MSEDKEMRELLDALKYTSSDRFKAVQRKFSTARNTISGDALSQPYGGSRDFAAKYCNSPCKPRLA
jgi:hypothetical protein